MTTVKATGIDRSLLKVEGRPRPADVQARLAERDQRLARDQRTDLQKMLGEPEPDRSALSARRNSQRS
jgi:hypothetical protein